jgi:hypothetical protein
MEHVISYGKRIAQNVTPVEAVDAMFHLRGDRTCGYVADLVLKPVEFAVRGDDADNRILIVKVTAETGPAYRANRASGDVEHREVSGPAPPVQLEGNML